MGFSARAGKFGELRETSNFAISRFGDGYLPYRAHVEKATGNGEGQKIAPQFIISPLKRISPVSRINLAKNTAKTGEASKGLPVRFKSACALVSVRERKK